MTLSNIPLEQGLGDHGDLRSRLAYLTSQYPAPSHTFIAREIFALEQQGWRIDRFSIRLGAAEIDTPAAGEVRDTYCVLKQSPARFLIAHLAWIFTHPGRYLGAARFAIGHRPPGVRALFLAGAHFAEAVVLARELRRRGCSHLHNHFANSAATVGLLAAKLAGIGWSFTMHGVSETDYPAGLLLGQKIKAADWVACASWFMRAQGLRVVANTEWQKLHVVRCGVAPAQLLFRPKSTIGDSAIVCVGRLSAEKAHAGLFEAFTLLSRKYPRARLRLVGDGPCRVQLEQLAAKLGIAERVEFLGSRSEESTLGEIATADLLVLPSLMEGLPVVLIEAMALGVPVVAPRVAGIPELVEDGGTGLLFTPSNWDALAARAGQLLENAQLRTTLLKQARLKVESEFDIHRSAEVLSDLFKQSHRKHVEKQPLSLSFGLREAIILAAAIVAIAIAVAATTNVSTPSSQPVPGSTVSHK